MVTFLITLDKKQIDFGLWQISNIYCKMEYSIIKVLSRVTILAFHEQTFEFCNYEGSII